MASLLDIINGLLRPKTRPGWTGAFDSVDQDTLPPAERDPNYIPSGPQQIVDIILQGRSPTMDYDTMRLSHKVDDRRSDPPVPLPSGQLDTRMFDSMDIADKNRRLRLRGWQSGDPLLHEIGNYPDPWSPPPGPATEPDTFHSRWAPKESDLFDYIGGYGAPFDSNRRKP